MPILAEDVRALDRGITLRGARLTEAILIKKKRVENRHFKMKPGL